MKQTQDLSRQPLFNIRLVSERTGIAPETLRAWERRYGYPNPHRNQKGYRLYTEDEIATLNWLKSQTEAGMTIGQATKLLDEMVARGQDQALDQPRLKTHTRSSYKPVEKFQAELIQALTSVNEKKASEVIQSAFTHHPMKDVLMEVIAPTLEQIGDRWHSGEIPIAIEHFGSQICRRHLIQAMVPLSEKDGRGRIVAAGAPGEWHELGLLMLTLLLQERGLGVTYLGPNLGLERFSEILTRLDPHLVLFSANSTDTAERLYEMIQVLEELPDPKPLIGLGGQAFIQDPTLINRLPGTFFGTRADDAVRQIEQVVDHLLRKQRA